MSSHTYRILHTADWHLGKMLNEKSREEELGQFLDWLLGVVKEFQIDAIILAGDVFDTASPPQSAIQQYFNFVSALFKQGGCALVVVAGNHDSAAHLEAPRRVLQALNVHVVGFLADDPKDRLLCLPDAKNPLVAMAMVPFLRDRDLRTSKSGESAAEIQAQLVEGIKNRYAETAEATRSMGLACPVIGLGHLTVVGARPCDSERDIHIGGLGAVKPDIFDDAYAYVALGHLHRPQAADQAGRIRYAGSPIALSFSEAGDAKEVRILDVTPDGLTQSSLVIPNVRRLVQLRTTRADLAAGLATITTEGGHLKTWVEVVIEDATLQDDLNEEVRRLSEGKDFEVLKVLRGLSPVMAGMGVVEGVTDDEAINTLLDNPLHVFEHLLKEHQLDESEEAQMLKTTFARLVEMEAEAGSGGAS